MTQQNVAVVAVHGVADQQPSESAREVAALLRRKTTGPRYSVFSACATPNPDGATRDGSSLVRRNSCTQ